VYEPPKGSYSDKLDTSSILDSSYRVEGHVTNVEEEPSGELVENRLTRINNLLS